jgi:hypothetical protein
VICLQLRGPAADASGEMVERALATSVVAVGMIVLLTLMQHMIGT